VIGEVYRVLENRRSYYRIAASSMEPNAATTMQQKKQLQKSLCKHVTEQRTQIAI